MNIAYLFFEAKQLIDNFCVSTYGEHADFSDLVFRHTVNTLISVT